MRLRTIALVSSLAPFAALAVASCGGGSKDPVVPVVPVAAASAVAPVPVPTAAPPAEPVATMGVDEKAIDSKANPCEDFYAYACGTWMKETPIPDDQPDWMRSFDVIFERNETMLRQILEKDASQPAAGEPYAKELGDFYASCMDEKGVEALGAKPLAEHLAKLDAVKDPATLALALANLHKTGSRGLFNFYSGQDFKDATQVIGIAEQGGLGLPDRDYYLKADAKSKELRGKYETHVADMLVLLGDAPEVAKANAKIVLKLETALAKSSMTKVELRDPQKIYHRIELAGLEKAAPDFPWQAYFKELGVPGVTAINVAQPAFFKTVSAEVARMKNPGAAGAASASEWKTYLRWHLVHSNASTLPSKFVDEDFKFKSALNGAPKLLPRWKRCVRATDAAMGEALAQPFVAKTLGAAGKATSQAMINGIEASMKGNLERLGWMDEPTRAKAVEKLGLITNKIGYPDVWRKYDDLAIARASYYENRERAEAFEVKRQLTKIGKPLDRKEWQMTPPTVNAYYDSSLNEMVFPAGILQPPFYANEMTLGLSYGAIGMVMGHELTHGFDDEGCQFDGHGNLKEWWAPAVAKEFKKRTSCVASQFDEYVAVEDPGSPPIHVNGKLTLGENIADLGGLKLSYTAFKATLAAKGGPKDATGRFTPEQQFFLGYAQAWCGNMRNEMMRLLVTTNAHAPPRFRVVGPLSNLPEFAQAFACKEGSAMVRPAAKRCEVW
jgi:endothelin-converting enzyme/putative endopeptidase